MPDVVVVGGGHNGLVAACYLAMAGRSVTVLEALDRLGGGSRTEEVVPGHRFDLHSVAHNIINMTEIPDELDLAGAGLVYQEMDPFSVAIRDDRRTVRFHRSVEATVESIARWDPAEARAYRSFMDEAIPLVRTVLPAVRGQMAWRQAPARAANLIRFLGRAARRRSGAQSSASRASGILGPIGEVLGPYDSLLRRALTSDLTRGPVAAFAAHAGVGPSTPGGSLFAWWQAAYHLFGQWHARGGSQSLVDALETRARSLDVDLRCGQPVARIDAAGGCLRAVVTESGERIPAGAVVTAIDPQVALLDLLDPPLSGRAGADLAAARRGNVVQALVHVATDRLPPYPGASPDDYHGLQSYVDRLEDLTRAWIRAEAGELPDPLPLYAFTTSAIDPTLAPPERHTVYLACPAAPARVRGGWPSRTEELVERSLATVEARAPGFASSVTAWSAWTPDRMEGEGRWPGAHPMHLDVVLDQLGPLRPTRSLAGHRTPVPGLYVSGAGTSPTGGVAGTPGRAAARALLADGRRSRREHR